MKGVFNMFKKLKTKIVTSLFSAILLTSLFIDYASAASYTYLNQDVTAYTAPADSLTYYGTTPQKYKTAAVHPKTCGSPSSGTIFPFGAVIKTSTVLKTPSGTSMQYFTVEDMGDVFCSRGLTRQWFDIYFGYTSSDINQANLFGIKTVSYTVTY